jgi:hypothetical protein
MRPAIAWCVPALLACLVLVLVPACAGPRYFYGEARVERGPIANPHIVERVAPRDPDIPQGIERGAWAELAIMIYVFSLLVMGLIVLACWGMYEFFAALVRDGQARDYPHSENPDEARPPRAMLEAS